jgi:hypothetical protein
MEPQNGIALVEVEFMRSAVLNIGIQLDGFALMLHRPLFDKGKKKFPHSPRPKIRVDDDVIDLKLFAGVKADSYPAK